MNHSNDNPARIRLVSIEPLTEKPDYANIGGFEVTTTDNKKITFDWQEHGGNVSHTEDGRIGIEWRLSHFDAEHFAASNNGIAEPDWDSIVSGTLNEIYYEAGYADETNSADVPIAMKVESFEIGEIVSDGALVMWTEFPKESIDAYNERTGVINPPVRTVQSKINTQPVADNSDLA